jgi:FG-GAP repeat protein
LVSSPCILSLAVQLIDKRQIKDMKRVILLLIIVACGSISFAQSVGIGTNTPDASSILDVKSATKGVLIPRVSTAARNAIVNPATGLLVFDTTEKTIYLFDGNTWRGFAAMTDAERPASNYIYGPAIANDTTLTGYSVSMWDQFLAIGAPYAGGGINHVGTVYIYQYNGSTWQYFTTLTPPVATAGALYGQSVCLKGDYLIVGASGQVNGSSQAVGAAYIYYYTGGSFTSLQTLFGSVVGNGFGTTVAINQFGNYAAVSEPNATVNALANAGLVDVYNKPASTLALQQAISDASPAAYEYFGTALAMNPSGVNIAVGAPSKTVGSFSSNGYVAQFNRSGTWSQAHSFTPVGSNNLNIGKLVDISDQNIVWVVGGTNTLWYDDLSWSGGTIPPFSSPIDGVAIDPATQSAYVLSGSAVYVGGPGNKIKTLSSATNAFGSSQLVSGYNKNYVIGLPTSTNSAQLYEGAFYIGVSPQ